MALLDDINRVLRDFERYTGDGKPGAPTAAPLPTGDPSSGRHNLRLHDLRSLFVALAQSMGDPSALSALVSQIGTKAAAADVQRQVADLYDALEQAMQGALSGTRPAGDWSAASGAFPSEAATGDLYYVTTAGTVSGVAFAVGDRLIALRDGASSTTYAGHWAHERASGPAADALALAEALAADPVLSTDDRARRAALGLEPNRVTFTATGSRVVNPLDHAPSVHFLVATWAGDLTLDVAGILAYHDYTFINAGRMNTRLWLDCGDDCYFTGPGLRDTDASATRILVPAGATMRINRLGGNRIIFEVTASAELRGAATDSSWSYSARRKPDGTYDVTYTRANSISAGSESNNASLPASLNVSNATVETVTVGPKADGSPPPPLPPQVTKLGTRHGLAANVFAIRNPNDTAITHPITVRLTGVEDA